MATEVFKVGQLLALFIGEYSDRYLAAIVRVLKPIDETVWDEMRRQGLTTVPANGPREEWTYNDPAKCVAWLLAFGYVEEIESTIVDVDVPRFEDA